MFHFSAPNPTRVLIRGIITTILGVVIIAVPGLSLNTVVQFVGVLLVADGLVNLIISLIGKSGQQRVFFMVPRGTSSMIMGVILLLAPAFVVKFFMFIVGFILLMAGGSQLAMQLNSRPTKGLSWLFLVISLVALFGGVVMLFNPFKSAVAILIFLGVVITTYGLGEIVWALRLRKSQRQNPATPPSGTVDVEYEEVE